MDPWHILSGYDLEFAGMSPRERVRVMLEWFGRRQTICAANKFGRWLPDCNQTKKPRRPSRKNPGRAPRETWLANTAHCALSNRHR
jgi:hypothetical protein